VETIAHESLNTLVLHAAIRLLTSFITVLSKASRTSLATTAGFIPAIKHYFAMVSGSRPAPKLGKGKLEFKGSPYRFRTDIISLMANLATCGRAAQTSVAEKGGLEALMSQTYIDTNNPLQKEHAIFALRNLCEGNVDIQKQISKLQYQGVCNTKELAEMGVKVSNASGNVKISKSDK